MKLKNIKIRDKVVYIPTHLILAEAEKRILEENLGVVTNINDTYAFVRYLGNTNSQATRPEDLYSLSNRKDLADKVPDYDDEKE